MRNDSYAFYWLLYVPVSVRVPGTPVYTLELIYFTFYILLSCITLYPCITLCPWNSPTNCFSWLSQTLTLGR